MTPALGAFVELKAVGHRAAAGHQDAAIGALVAVVARHQDAQDEGPVLGFHRAAVIVEAAEDHAQIFIAFFKEPSSSR